MIVSQEGREGRKDEHLPLYHFTCRQISRLKMRSDEVVLNNSPIDRAFLVARVVGLEKGTSPRGLPVTNLRLEDSTGRCKVVLYEGEPCGQDYFKVGVSVKSAGVVFRPQIKLASHSMVPLTDYKQLTEHLLSCIKTELQTSN